MDNIEKCLVRRRQELYIDIIKKVFKLLINNYNFKVSDKELNKKEFNKSIYI